MSLNEDGGSLGVYMQVAQSLHFAGIGAQDLAADFHRLWKYEEAARVHVNLPASAQQVRSRSFLKHACVAIVLLSVLEVYKCANVLSYCLYK